MIKKICIGFFTKKRLLKISHQDELLEAGCDEAGRGCLAGPVFAAAVILPKDFFHITLNDSKLLTERERYELRPYIESKALAFSVSSQCNKKIDQVNILNASIKCMHIAVTRLLVKPGLLLIDGNRFKKYKKLPHCCIIQGDGIYSSIAAASILAKTYRDDYMKKLHHKHPKYNWQQNKGYATFEHREALNKYGPTSYHRKSFRLIYNDTIQENVGDGYNINVVI